MYRPRYFPDKFWLPVKTARETADADFAEWSARHPDAVQALADQAQALADQARINRVILPADRARIDLVILPVFFAFARALCDVARLGLIPIEEFEMTFDTDLHNFRLYLSAETRPGADPKFAYADPPDTAFNDAAHQAILDSPEWIAHKQERAEVRRQRLAPEPAAAAQADSNRPPIAADTDEPQVPSDLITVSDAAAICAMDSDTVYKWIQSGQLPFWEVGPKKSKRVRRRDVERLIRPA
jgi:excisionase family DNA binding protein